MGLDANKLRAVIAKCLGIDTERVTDEVHFRNDFDLDSLDQLELLILIEEEFSGVEFSDNRGANNYGQRLIIFAKANNRGWLVRRPGRRCALSALPIVNFPACLLTAALRFNRSALAPGSRAESFCQFCIYGLRIPSPRRTVAINGRGETKHGWQKRIIPPVTVSPIELDDIDIEREAKEAAERIAITRTIRQGLDARQAIDKAESFDSWKAIGAALAIGKARALKVTGANAPWGRNYSREFGQWIKAQGFGTTRASDRSHAIELHESFAAITAWRATLPECERRRLIGAQANVKRWRKETRHSNGKCPTDLRREAEAAWRRFVACVEMLPADQAAALWHIAQVQAATALAR